VRPTGKWVAFALSILAVVGVARDPLFWKRYLLVLMGSSEPQSALYQPRELVPGGNEPPAPRVAPELESLDKQALETAAAYAGARNSNALIVTRHDHIVFEKYWNGTGFDTVEDAQSFPRILAALATGIALADRKIGWPDEPIGNFITEWRNDPRGAITVTNLLQMSSGLRTPGPSLNPWGAGVRASLGADVIAAHLAQPLSGTPGMTWADQSADPQLLALIVERATGERYASYVSTALWRRIGAGDAWLWLDRQAGTAHADCCMLARQGDWVRIAELLVKDGNYRGDEVVRPGWVARMLIPAKGNANFGSYVRLGARNEAGMEPYATSDVFLVEGSGGNRLWIVPSLHMAILRMGRMPRNLADWDDARIPNLIIRGVRDYLPPQARPGTDLSKLVPNH
jgi:CubicO group peptidase (beta-lactamase class C family)